jgi:branched-chain amino acid transport system substrate-binding protein
MGSDAGRRCDCRCDAGHGNAQQGQPVKIGLLATLEGPFAAGGADGMRGAELAVKQRGGVVAGRKIEIIKASSDAKPDVAVNSTRKLVEQDKVGHHGRPAVGRRGHRGQGLFEDAAAGDVHQRRLGRAGRQPSTTPARIFFRFNTDGGQWMVGLARRRWPRATRR